jgi:hypothetical protein
MLYQNVQIINGDHEAPHPFVVVDRFGMHVDLSRVIGQLWDGPTVAEVSWGHRPIDGRRFGIVALGRRKRPSAKTAKVIGKGAWRSSMAACMPAA